MSGQVGHFRFPDPSGDETNVESQTSPLRGPGVGGEALQAANQESIGTSPAANNSQSSRRSLVLPGGLVGFMLLLLLVSFAPHYGSEHVPQSVSSACGSLHGSDYETCKHETLGDSQATAGLHWNAWGSWLSWPAIVLFLIVAAVVAFKAVFSKSEKVVLSRQVRLGLLLADLLFLVSVFHVPHDNAGRSWGLWLSLTCVIAINVGILLATTEAGEWIAEHWPQRAKPSAPTVPLPTPTAGQQADYRPTPQAMPPGHRQPNWPPPAGQQAPPLGQQHFPPSDPR